MRYLKRYQLFESQLSPVIKVIKRDHIDEINDMLLDSEDEYKISKREWLIDDWVDVDIYTYNAQSISFSITPKRKKILTDREASEFFELVMRIKDYYDMYMKKELRYGINIHVAKVSLDKNGNNFYNSRENIEYDDLENIISMRFSSMDMCIYVE